MSRRSKRWLGLLVIVSSMTVCSAWFALASEVGTAWIIARLAEQAPGRLAVEQIRGTLATAVVLEGLSYEDQEVSLVADRVMVRVRLMSLLSRHIDILEATVDRSTIEWHGTATAEESGPITLPTFAWPLSIHSFIGTELQIRIRDEPESVGLDTLSILGLVAGADLRVDRLEARSSAGSLLIAGRIGLGETTDIELETTWSLDLETSRYRGQGLVSGNLSQLEVTQSLQQPYEARVSFTVNGLSGSPRILGTLEIPSLPVAATDGPAGDATVVLEIQGPPDELVCDGRIDFRARDRPSLSIAGRAILRERHELEFDRVALTQEGLEGEVRGSGSISLRPPHPLELTFLWADLAGAADGPWRDLSSQQGELRVVGSSARWSARLSGDASAAGYPDGRLQLAARGSDREIEGVEFEAKILGGIVTGTGSLSLSDQPAWQLDLRGTGIDPSGIWPQWPGRLSFSANADQPGQRDLEGRFVFDSIEGDLRGLPVAGRAELVTAASRRGIEDLELRWGGLSISGSAGFAGPWNLEWSLDAPRLEEYLPGLEGSLVGNGSLAGKTANSRRLRALVTGRELGWRTVSAKTIDLEIEALVADGGPAELHFEATGMTIAQREIDRLEARIRGTAAAHEITVIASAPGKHTRFSADGHLGTNPLTWSARTDDLEFGSLEAGLWHQVGVARTELTADAVSMSDLCVASGSAELCGMFSVSPGQGISSHVRASSVPLQIFEIATLPVVGLSGELDGDLKLSWKDHSPPELDGSLQVSAGEVTVLLPEIESLRLPIRDARLVAHPSATAQRVELNANFGATGEIAADLAIKPADDDSSTNLVGGFVHVSLSDLSTLAPLAPAAWSSAGQLNLELDVSGTLRDPVTAVRGRVEKVDLVALFVDRESPLRFGGSFEATHSKAAGLAVLGELSTSAGSQLPTGSTSHVPLGISNVEVRFGLSAAEAWCHLDAGLSEGGFVEARVALPAPRFPFSASSDQEIRGHVRASVADLSRLGLEMSDVLFFSGRLDAEYDIHGSVAEPRLDGRAILTEGQLLLPELGTSVSGTEAELIGDPRGTLEVRASGQSGSGSVSLTGKLPIRPSESEPGRLRLFGNGVRVWDRPGFEVEVSPELEIELTESGVLVSGVVDIDHAKIDWESIETIVTPSRDVVLVVAGELERPPLVTTRSEILVDFGEAVSFQGSGIQSRITGAVTIVDQTGSTTQARGSLRFEDGRFSIYGRDLTIDRGQLSFLGGSIYDPILDLSASRKSSDGTIAGIRAIGPLRDPKVSLWSSPPASETDSLSHLVLGRPLGGTSVRDRQALGGAALSLGLETAKLLASSFGLKTDFVEVSVEADQGYQQASLFLGRQLSSRLYMSYGVGLLSGLQTLRLKYSLGRAWALEAESGETAGGDVSYHVERRPNGSSRSNDTTERQLKEGIE